MRLVLVAAALLVSSLGLVTSRAAAEPLAEAATEARLALTHAETELVLGAPGRARADLARAAIGSDRVLNGRPALRLHAKAALEEALRATENGDGAGLSAAAAAVWAAIVRAGFLEAVEAAKRGDVAAARSWLLVRDFRPPTRFTRASADATLAIQRLEQRSLSPSAAAAAVRNDLLDTYEARLRTSLDDVGDAWRQGFEIRQAGAAAAAAGYWAIVRPAFLGQRGERPARALDGELVALERAVAARSGVQATLRTIDGKLAGFRAAPLGAQEELRRAGQLDRFLRLVPIEYGRGVRDGRVVLDFEIQEAITFRDGAAAALRDLEPRLFARDRAAARELAGLVDSLGDVLARASRGEQVAEPDLVRATTDRALALIEDTIPAGWRQAAGSADFDVIAVTLDRLRAAAAAGDWGRAEQARLEAYGVFELGPEQRLRGLAPGLFQEIEGLFWYGSGDTPGLVVLLGRKASAGQLASTLAALTAALAEAEARIGAGPGSRLSVVANSAIIVFREGLEAVLILAALMASLVGAQRRHRRPLLAGVVVALAASVLTWLVAQTVLDSLAGWGERLEAVVSLVAIAVLLLILNWFYHRVYWQENLHDLHRRKKRILSAGTVGIVSGQALGLVMLGFSSVYREGFETVLFLQALTLEAGAWMVLQGVALGFVGVLAVFVLVVALERRLPHKKMLIATGILITGVLVVLVGQTAQTMQAVGWIPVTPIDGFLPPYWVGLWLGVHPTWEGVLAQAGAAFFVVGSYLAAEQLRRRRRRLVIARADERRPLAPQTLD